MKKRTGDVALLGEQTKDAFNDQHQPDGWQ
jgi:hypothetical protein